MKMQYAILLGLVASLVGCAHPKNPTVDLSTPEATVVGFTRAAAEGNAKLAQSYFLPGGVDYQDIGEILTAEPGATQYPARLMMASVDTARPMRVKSQQQSEHGLKVVWQVTFGKPFEIQGRRVEAGTEYDFDATLKKTEDGWLIDNF